MILTDTKEYITFVLGYDELIREKFEKYRVQECDIAYQICDDIATEFFGSIYNTKDNMGDISMYDELRHFLENTNTDRYFERYTQADWN